MFTIRELLDLFKDKNILIEYNINNDEQEEILEVIHDTRQLSLHRKSLYVAIKGVNYDGHDFIKNLAGISAVLSEKKLNLESSTVIVVKDTVRAYGILASYWRTKNKFKVLAISGSNGKTTTKELIFHILKENKYKVYRSPKNFNNLIGVPYSILQAPSNSEYLILEFGMNSYGELTSLSNIAKPDFVYLTNIGTAHIGFFGNRENILKAKAELFDYAIKNSKPIFINLTDELLQTWYKAHKTYKNMIKLREDKDLETSLVNFKAYNNQNAVLAIQIAEYLGVSRENAIDSLKTFKFPKLRSNWFFSGNLQFFVDCYNANYDSMIASLSFIAQEKPRFNGRRIVVLGDMNELGDKTRELHNRVAKQLRNFDIHKAFFVGKYADYYRETCTIEHSTYIDIEGLVKDLKEYLKDNDMVLLKASRTVALERVLGYFKGE